jgi:hypothetical protein
MRKRPLSANVAMSHKGQQRTDIIALVDRQRYLPRPGLADDASLRKVRLQRACHPVDVGLRVHPGNVGRMALVLAVFNSKEG